MQPKVDFIMVAGLELVDRQFIGAVLDVPGLKFFDEDGFVGVKAVFQIGIDGGLVFCL